MKTDGERRPNISVSRAGRFILKAFLFFIIIERASFFKGKYVPGAARMKREDLWLAERLNRNAGKISEFRPDRRH